MLMLTQVTSPVGGALTHLVKFEFLGKFLSRYSDMVLNLHLDLIAYFLSGPASRNDFIQFQIHSYITLKPLGYPIDHCVIRSLSDRIVNCCSFPLPPISNEIFSQ